MSSALATKPRLKLPCQVCGRLLTTRKDGLTKPHKRRRGAEDYCAGSGHQQARWAVGQWLRHHAGSVWVVDQAYRDGYLIRCPDGQKSLWRDEWIEQPGKTLRTHAEYMHRHGWSAIETPERGEQS